MPEVQEVVVPPEGGQAVGQQGAAAVPFQPQPTLHIKPPIALKLGDDKSGNWKLWKQVWDNYCTISNMSARTVEYQRSYLITTMGMEALALYNGLDPADNDTAADIINKLNTHILGETNETFERYKFNTRIQKKEESIDTYVAVLKTLAKSCNFCACLKDTLLRDRIVLGVRDDDTRQRLLQERGLTLQSCLDICRCYESTSSQLKMISGKQEEIHRVYKKPKSYTSKPKFKGDVRDKRPHFSSTSHAGKSSQPIITCKFCARKHPRNKELCPAWGKSCNKCHGQNHFSKCCKGQGNRKVHGVLDSAENSEVEDIFSVYTSLLHNVSDKGPIYAEMLLQDNVNVKFQVDCGATVNVIPQRFIDTNRLNVSKSTLHMYSKSMIEPVGKCRLVLRNPQTRKKYGVEFQVVKEDLTPLLCRKAAEQMNLITVNYDNFKQIHTLSSDSVEKLVSEYSSVFDKAGIGLLPGEVHLHVEEGAKPVQCPPRRVPISVKPKLKGELNHLVDMGVLVPVEEPTEWCSQISVQTKKSGQLRECIDQRPLNEVLQRERYPLPTIDDILPELEAARVFSKVDLAHGYLHCKLDEESSALTTTITPFGRFKWTRLPFGMKVSAEIFQRMLMQNLVDLEGVVCVADDILIYGVNKEQHNKRLKNLFNRCSERGIRLNLDKCVFDVSELEFLGHIVTRDGLKPDVKKVDAILNMQNPVDTAGVLRLQGTVNYLAKFLPHLSTVMEPIRRLTHQDAKWEWTQEHDTAMSEIKKLVTSAPLLIYYNPKDELVVQCDSSSTGMGATLLQNGKPICYASRALTKTECGYTQIEKECLAIVFSM